MSLPTFPPIEPPLSREGSINEIISSIARTYQYISRIDIQADYFEEISNRDVEHLKYIHSGILSESNRKVCSELVAEEYQDAFYRFTDISTLPERMKDEESVVMEYRMKDGSWHSLRFIEKKRDENGRLTHVLCAIRSISDAKRREQTLIYQAAEAKKDAAVKTRFLSNMSHNIRTPVNGIMGMIELEFEEFSDQELSFDLADLLSRANTGKQILAEEKNVEFVVDWEKSDMRHTGLKGNPVYLERILTAVADNAVKFTEPGGCVQVWCVEKEADHDHVVYEFTCSDNGIGMSEAFIPHVFEMFSQENETCRSRYEETGLGPAIARKMADRLGCGTQDPFHEKKGYRYNSNHCHECQCICGRHHQQPYFRYGSASYQAAGREKTSGCIPGVYGKKYGIRYRYL